MRSVQKALAGKIVIVNVKDWCQRVTMGSRLGCTYSCKTLRRRNGCRLKGSREAHDKITLYWEAMLTCMGHLLPSGIDGERTIVAKIPTCIIGWKAGTN